MACDLRNDALWQSHMCDRLEQRDTSEERGRGRRWATPYTADMAPAQGSKRTSR